jgi:hypothetical protein
MTVAGGDPCSDSGVAVWVLVVVVVDVVPVLVVVVPVVDDPVVDAPEVDEPEVEVEPVAVVVVVVPVPVEEVVDDVPLAAVPLPATSRDPPHPAIRQAVTTMPPRARPSANCAKPCIQSPLCSLRHCKLGK